MYPFKALLRRNSGLGRLAALFFASLAIASAHAATFTVTSAEDDGVGTLREAIQLANATLGADTIRFQLGPGSQTISVLSPLPDITEALLIDGTTQPGYSNMPLVELEGSFAASTDTDGLRIAAAGCRVRGLCINRFGRFGIQVSAANATVEDCYIGLDTTGELGLGCTIGVVASNAPGLLVQRCAVLSNLAAIKLEGSASGSLIQQSNIGTNALGLAAVGTGEGVVLEGATGAPTVQSCLLGGCLGAAVRVSSSTGAVIDSNTFGLSRLLDPLLNFSDSIVVEESPDTILRGNLITFAFGTGIVLTGANTSNARLENNGIYSCLYGIEVRPGATGARINDCSIQGCLADGVFLHALAGSDNQFLRCSVLGNFGNGATAYGSQQRFESCRFEDNGGDGVLLGRQDSLVSYAQQVTVAASTFRNNGDLPIRLVTRRDLNQGANNLQPTPVLSQAFTGGASSGAIGSLSAAPNKTYRIEFFGSVNPDPSGFGEGEVYLGSVSVTTDGGGNAPIIAGGLATTPEGIYLTATATDAVGNTSEFSNAIPGSRNQGPILEQISPDTVIAGSGAFTLIARGQNFTPFSKVQWDGTERTTTFVSSTELRASIAASDVTTPRTLAVTVFTPPPGGGTSAPMTFTVANPAPVLTGITPTRTTAASPTFTLTATGSNFVSGSKIRWNGTERTTTFVSATELRATIPAADVVTAGTASVTVFTPTPGGGESAPQTFTIANPVPAITTLTPASAFAGSSGFTLTVEGTGFVPTSQMRWNGSNRPTTYQTPTRLTVEIPTTDLALGGAYDITVTNPAPEGGVSNVARFTVAGLPQLALASATAVRIGGAVEVTLTLRNVGSAVLVAGRIRAAVVSGAPSTSTLPLTFPDLAAGATSLPITLVFPDTLTAGRKVLAITATSVGRTYSASRLVIIP